MPVTFDLSKDKWFASHMKRERRKGREEGQQEGARQVVRLQLEKRFGRLPAPIVKRLTKLSDRQAQELALAIIDAKSLKELFGA